MISPAECALDKNVYVAVGWNIPYISVIISERQNFRTPREKGHGISHVLFPPDLLTKTIFRFYQLSREGPNGRRGDSSLVLCGFTEWREELRKF